MINDTLGHSFGDRLIKEVSIRLTKAAPNGCTWLKIMAGMIFDCMIQS